VSEKERNEMRTRLYHLALPVALVMATGTMAWASPLKVRTGSGDAQAAAVCPHCGHPMASNPIGDYTVSFSGDEAHPKTGSARFEIGLTERTGKPVTGAQVALTLSMPAHHHGPVAVPVRGGSGGRYTAVTALNPHMRGQWSADVQITTPKGDKLTRTFNFDQ
jgi:hypothetical protein